MTHPLDRISAALTLAAACLSPLFAQAPPAGDSSATRRAEFRALRTALPITVDGALDDVAWSGEPTFELLHETRPGDNTAAKVRTLGWVAFDDRNLYFAFQAFDPDPKSIRARFTDRDRAFQDDFVGLVLDTFNDERRAFEFFVNPLGVQMDLVQDDVSGNEDESWDAIWDSAGRLTENGYVVEAAIPLSTLRFPDGAAASGTWGIDALRVQPRSSRVRIGLNRIERGRNCYLCQASKLVGLTGIQPGRDIELDPTLTSVRTEAREPFPTGGYETIDDPTEGGLTARWGITPSLTLQGTLNPDFSQIEADAAQLDVNNQFALFYPEKRPFFLEGADYFETEINAVHTRDIADPDWGVKLSGKQGRFAVGLILAEDRTTNLLLPSSQGSRLASLDDANYSAIARARRDIGDNSTLGLLYTDRSGGAYSNRLLGGDALHRVGEKHTLRFEGMFSQTRYPQGFALDYDQPLGAFSGHAVNAEYEYSTEKWRGYAEYRDLADGFRADLGFIGQVDYRRMEVCGQRIWNGNGERWYDQISTGANVDETRTQAGDLVERELEAWWYASGPLQSEMNFGGGGGTEVFQGLEVDKLFVFGYFGARPASWFNFYVEAAAKQGIDYANVREGDETSISTGLRFDIGRHLRLTVDDRFERVDVEGGRLFAANVVEVRATYQFNLRTFVRVISQYFEIDRDPGLYTFEVESNEQELFNQLLFSYKINPQTVLFAGYSDTAFGSPSIDLTRESRTVFLKLGYAWRL